MSRTSDLRDWFETQVPGSRGSLDNLPQGQPNRAFAVRFVGGLGLEVEDAIDKPTFYLFVRGVNGEDAEEFAMQLDQAWIDAPSMMLVGETQVKGKGRFGGPPSYVGPDASEEFPGRVVRSAIYWYRIVR